MARIVIDEDQSRSLGRLLGLHGHDVKDVRDHGLRGADDEKIFLFAQKNKAVLVTGDFGFSNILRYPPASHEGIVIVHFPNEMTTERVDQEVATQLKQFSSQETLKGHLIILEPGRTRIRGQD